MYKPRFNFTRDSKIVVGGTEALFFLLNEFSTGKYSYQKLADHRSQAVGEHGADLLLIGGRKGVDHAVDGRVGRDRMECTEDEMSSLGGGDGERDSGQIPHLAHHEDVRILAQG